MCAAKSIELSLCVLDVASHRRRAERQDFSDFVVGFTSGDPLHNFTLARRKRNVHSFFPPELGEPFASAHDANKWL
jgi:hypothetical protein